MATKILIPQGYMGESTILSSPFVTLLFFDKNELNDKDLTPYLKRTGIYILYNQNYVYVGQSANKDGVLTRLQRHLVEKTWWEKTIVIIPNQLMTKAHYDYLEKTYIELLSRRNHLQNQNKGNTSPITDAEQEQCELLIAHVNTLCGLLNVNISQLTTKAYHEHLEETIRRLLDGTLEDESFSQLPPTEVGGLSLI